MQDMYPGKVNSPQTELASAIDDEQTTIPLLDASVLPDPPNLCTIGTGEDAETVLYTGKSGNNLTGVTRGFQGAAKAWVQGTKVARNFTAYDYDALRQNVEELDASKATVTHGSAHTEFGADPISNATPTEGGLMSAQDKRKLDNLAYQIGWFSFYQDIEDIGLDPGWETIEDFWGRMNEPSILIYDKFPSNPSTIYPAPSGVLIATKSLYGNVIFEFFGTTSPGGGRPIKWTGIYNPNGGFTGWSQDALDYETGTFTPELRFGGSSQGIEYWTRDGRYTRIENVVHYAIQIQIRSKGSATGGARIGGLPFVSRQGTPHMGTAIGSITGLTLPSGAYWAYGKIGSSSSEIGIFVSGTSANELPLTHDHFSNDGWIYIEGKYFI